MAADALGPWVFKCSAAMALIMQDSHLLMPFRCVCKRGICVIYKMNRGLQGLIETRISKNFNDTTNIIIIITIIIMIILWHSLLW